MRRGVLATLSAQPHALLAELREREPVAWIEELGGWLITRRDLALEVLRDSGRFTVDDPRFTTSRVVGASMLSRDGPEHERHRAPFTEPFRRPRVQALLGDVVARETDHLIGAFAADGRADLSAQLAGPLAAAVTTHALGLGHADTPAVLGWYRAIVHSVQQMTAGGPPTEAGRGAYAQLRAAIDPALRAEPSSSLLAAAVGAGHGALSHDEAASNAGVLLFGGIETTEGMIANALLFILGEPEPPADIEGAIEESLRLEPAAAMVDRYATRDTVLGGTQLAARDLVSVSVTAANRDPATFDDPDRFDPSRRNTRRHLAFASGPHVCIGVHLARLEAHTAVARVLERLAGLRVDPDRRTAPAGLVFRKPPRLDVLFDPQERSAVRR